MNNFDYIVTLGHNCIPSLYAFAKKKFIENPLFDHVWTPAWAIKELLVNKFDGFFDKTKYEYMQAVEGSPLKFPTNKQYFIKFYPDDPIKNFDDFVHTFRIKKNIFYEDILKSNKKILFLRYEEPIENPSHKLTGKGIMSDEHAVYYQNNEIYHMTELSYYLQATYPNLHFHIMLIGNPTTPAMELNYDPISQLFTIPNEHLDFANYEKVLDKIFTEHETFISTSLSIK